MQQDANCYGQVYSAYPVGMASFTSANTSICNPVLNTGTMRGVGPGGTNIFAGWTADTWSYNLDFCQYTPVEAFREAICQACAKPTDETTAFVGWATPEGQPTIGRWTQTLLPSST